MKLNELNEVDMSQMFGNYGAAALQQTGKALNPFDKSGESELSVKDRMAKNNFISDFIGRATTNLASAIESGLVDPTAKEAPTPAAGAAPDASPVQGAVPDKPGAGAAPGAQPTTAPAGETPEQKRIRLQKAAQQNIDKTAMPFSKVTPKQPTQPAATPASIRQQKQAAAGAAAQQQMAPVSKLPANQQAIAAGNVRQKQQAAAGAVAQKQAAPFSKVTPAPAVWKNNRKPAAPAQRRPVVKESAFSKLNYIFESIVNIDEADPAVPATAEAPKAQTISQYVKNMFTKYLKGVNISSPQVQTQLNNLANEVQATYGQDKGKAAFSKLANLGFAISYADAGSATGVAGAEKPAGAMDAIKAGISQGLGKEAGATAGASAAAGAGDTAGATSAVGADADPFVQAKDMIGKLDKAGKQQILAAIDKEIGGAVAAKKPADKKTVAKKPSTTTAPSGAMSNMARQLAARGQSQTSTGGATIATGKGIRHAASPTNPNQAPSVDAKIAQAKQMAQKRQTSNKAQQRAQARKASV